MTFEPPPRADYIKRVNQAIDHILQHLDQPLRLDDLASIAGFSSFHFHRVFRSLVGEPLNQFVKRLRLERALTMMSREGTRSLTDVALSCGFSSSSDFSRTFKQRYGMAPSAFDVRAFRKRNRGVLEAVSALEERGHQLDSQAPPGNPHQFEVQLRALPARTVAYIRVLNPFGGRRVMDAADRLMAWADERGKGAGQWLGYMWDDPEIVALKDCRYDVGVEVDDMEPSGEVGRLEFPAMTVAQIEIRGGIELELQAVDWLFGEWLPASGYVPTDAPSFEAWMGRPFATGWEQFELFVQLPVARR
jgi:AraC family transcriptional regulator